MGKFTQLRQVLGDLLWHWAPFGCCETLEKDVGQKDEALTGLEEGKIREIYTRVPVDPLEWQISQDTANNIVACMANTIGAAESVLRVAATGHDKRLFVKVVVCLYVLSALGRVVSGVTVAYAGLWLFCLYMFAENSQTICACMSRFMRRRDNI
ncbi:reticulon-like protein B22 isoform X2 [Vitis vinifera]|uniref:reticulon-like protein B22 isoform X2 n=1 Tax=Vitis vinifera TaxID=29760 RepID=UPI0008FFB298|nr:reticulon-like protein B22 isoform X2 [Vitis vinifera]|eukprot:XP_019077745.1 PREDICTED: reticulon-like protein B22 isoform X4 [Vitis vinifera]